MWKKSKNNSAKIENQKRKLHGKIKVRNKDSSNLKKVVKSVEKREKSCDKKGDFHIKVSCYNGGRIVEFFKREGGVVWDFSCEKGEIEFFCSGVSLACVKKILSYCGGEDVEISRVGNGEKLRQNMAVLIGVLVFCVTILLSNLFVFSVVVSGEDDVLKVHIENIASEIFAFGSLKSDENIENLKSELSSCEDIAFFTVEIYQNTLQINFLKAENAVVIEKNQSVVSPESGILISLSTLSGTPQKAAGDYVEKGEVLILATACGDEKSPTEKAMGSGILQVEKTATYTFSQISTERIYSGNSETVTYLKIGETEIFPPESSFENYIIQKSESVFLTPNITIISETRMEYQQSSNVYTTSELEDRAIAIFRMQNLQEFAHTITEISVESNWDGQECKVELKCEYLLQFDI